MAITNLPYHDERIVSGVADAHVISTETRDVRVDFTGTGVSPDDTATITATVTWTVPAADAVRVLDAARVSEHDAVEIPGDVVVDDPCATPVALEPGVD
jgi:hypothetical protein